MGIGRLGIHQMIRLDSFGNDMSDGGAVSRLIFLRLLYPDCDVLLMVSICVHVPMSLRARTSAPDGWL